MPDALLSDTVEFTPIVCNRLDKDNADWVKKYVARWKDRLERDGGDPELAAYARREIAAHEELLARFDKPKS